MHDREKVIKGIQKCDLNGGLIGNCPYKGILELLKEQEEDIQNLRRENHNILTQFHEWAKEQEAVVKCRDCIHWDKGTTEECENSDSVCFHNGRCKPDWFCADGEAKT